MMGMANRNHICIERKDISMGDYKGKVAVITGGGGGIAHGIGLACAKEGMHLVLADINQDRLDKNKAELSKEGTEVLTVIADATKEADMQNLAQKTLDKFGRVDMLFNNAGIHFHKDFRYLTDNDFNWIFNTNFWSVIYGMRTFIPIMEKQGGPCHITNTSSAAGALPGLPTMSHYSAVKYAVRALTEGVLYELRVRESNVNMSVLMPAYVTSNLMYSAADCRPKELCNAVEMQTELDKTFEQTFEELLTKPQVLGNNISISNEEAGQIVLDAIKQGKNFIFTHFKDTTEKTIEYTNMMIDQQILIDLSKMV